MSDENPLSRGAALIRGHVARLPETPGVYRMLNAAGDVLYVGKAKALKKRVVSYTHVEKLPIRLKRMVAETTDMEFVHTGTEVEALLLEANLIKTFQPRYNILLRDDKSFPYIMITGDHDFPQVKKHRGARDAAGEYFGPFAGAGAVNHTIEVLQRAFRLRNCSDSVFKGRSRPCLQYHIKRCTAPCVGKISQDDYAGDVDQARAFLSGRSQAIQQRFADRMAAASAAQDYEQAAEWRDRIRALTSIQSHQDINIDGIGDADVLAIARREGKTGIQVFFFRGGQNFGNRSYFPRHDAEEGDATILSVFMAQFYQSKPVPKDIFVNVEPEEKDLLEQALGAREASPRRIHIHCPSRGDKKRLVDFAVRNADEALSRHLAERQGEAALLSGVAELFGLDAPPQRIEVYDNSHLGGTNMVGGMIVAGAEGFRKSAYRKFNIRNAEAGDDYGMMREVMSRRFGGVLEEKGGEDWPDVLLIDGGQGQYNVVKEILTDLGVWDDLVVVAIAKGVDRNAGREWLFIEGRQPFQLPEQNPILHYLQRLRDESHRFVIGAQRTRRKMEISRSPLDDIPGIGARRKRDLLRHFGSAKAVAGASVADIKAIPGISADMAERIYRFFNEK